MYLKTGILHYSETKTEEDLPEIPESESDIIRK